MLDVTLASVIALVCLAALFDYSNGFHDAANSIATVVSTRVLSPRLAVVWAAFFNSIAFVLMLTLMWVFRSSAPRRVDHLFRRLQLLSAAAFSLGHGGNDAQKTMAIIAAVAYWMVARLNHVLVLVLLLALTLAGALLALALRHPRSTVSPQR